MTKLTMKGAFAGAVLGGLATLGAAEFTAYAGTKMCRQDQATLSADEFQKFYGQTNCGHKTVISRIISSFKK